MMAEELDAFPGFPAPELLEQFEADPRFRVNQGNTEGEVILAINNAKPPFDNIEVRRAISTASFSPRVAQTQWNRPGNSLANIGK